VTPGQREDLIDAIAEAIQDAEGPNSTSYAAAAAIVRMLEIDPEARAAMRALLHQPPASASDAR